ncbi:MAG: NUDIX domain-containing protein [Alphaproteobacteria bacterium]|nr:NUDIX domain-containing protein [Alphaproteobacteria bacterium]
MFPYVNGESGFGPDDVELMARERVFSGYFAVDRLKLRHRRYDGEWTQPIQREVFISGDAVVVLPYDPVLDNVVLIEQFRAGPYANTNGANAQDAWLIETIAGRFETGEAPEAVARREAIEEAGCHLGQFFPMGVFYQSPGCIAEKIHYYCAITDSSELGGLHGCDHEDEDIRVIVMPRVKALEAISTGRICDITLAFALQWLELNRVRVLRDSGLLAPGRT